jgi:preprotein translocase subunit SecG
MIFLLYLLGVLMFLDCVLLIFLVLLQLPKKEAGMGGTAFGGAATDALFGAGSGNVLTKITKYVAGLFFILAIMMAWLDAYKPESGAASLAKKLSQSSGGALVPSAPPATTPATPAAPAAPATAPADGGLLQLSNLAPAGASNAAPAPPPAAPVNTNK